MSETTSRTELRPQPLSVGIVLFPGFEPLDAIGPAQVFWSLTAVRPVMPEAPAVAVHLVAEHAGLVRGAYGFTIEATHTYESCPELDVIIVPGGSGAGEPEGDPSRLGRFHYAHDEAMLGFVQCRARRAEVAASVCTGAFILAGAGLLGGRRVTTHWAARDELVAQMARRGEPFDLAAERVVDDGHVVTAGGVSSGIDLALHLVERLLGATWKAAVSAAMELETPGAAA